MTRRLCFFTVFVLLAMFEYGQEASSTKLGFSLGEERFSKAPAPVVLSNSVSRSIKTRVPASSTILRLTGSVLTTVGLCS